MRTDYLLHKEVEHVLAALMPQNRLIMRLCLHTGLRLSDVLCMTPEQIKPSGWLVEQKTGKRRRYGIPAPLLGEILLQSSAKWAFPGRNPANHKTRQAVWADVKRASKAFRLRQNVGPHSFRKVYAVDLLRRYGDIERVRKNLNHSSQSVTAIYAMADVLLERKLAARRKVGVDRPGPP